MSRRLAFALWLALSYCGLLAVIAGVALAASAGLPAADREVLARLLEERAPLLVSLAVLLLFLCGAVVSWLHQRYVIAPLALAEQTRVVLGANPEHRIALPSSPELAQLAAEINRLAAAYQGAQRDMEAKVAEAASGLAEERNRLAALMSELTQSVLLCNAEGRILLYNEQARALFGAPRARQAGAPVGLGRSIFSLLDRDEVAHALDKLQYALDQGLASPITRFVTTGPKGALLRVQMAPYLAAGGEVGGFVLALEDVTRLVGQEEKRRSLLEALAARVRAPVASIRATAENLVAFPEIDAPRRERFTQIIAQESRALSGTIDRALQEYADALKAGIALEDMCAADLLSVARRRIDALLAMPVALEEVDESLWIRVDSFAFVQALAFLAARLREEYGVRSLALRVRASGGFAALDLAWKGAGAAGEALRRWEAQPMQVGAEHTPLTLKDVLDRHGGEIWSQSDKSSDSCCFRFLLPLGEAVTAPTRRRFSPESRPEFYDFDLFRRPGTKRELQEQPLGELSYTAFDTETTGLEPSAGDEIISIGAVRIVNGRLLKHEVFEQLVDPRRPLDPRSSRVHGIDARALAGQPSLDEVLPAFHRFCEETVLVAHNAAFDMRFLELKEASTGVRFTQPVLDTLLLSAVAHPNLEDHRLETIAERLGVPVIGRHTALGDALVTGDVLLKLIPLLAEQGVVTLRQALAASQQTYNARLQY
jgi:DNA polymerase-3 subunit epsilon